MCVCLHVCMHMYMCMSILSPAAIESMSLENLLDWSHKVGSRCFHELDGWIKNMMFLKEEEITNQYLLLNLRTSKSTGSFKSTDCFSILLIKGCKCDKFLDNSPTRLYWVEELRANYLFKWVSQEACLFESLLFYFPFYVN